MKQKKRSRKSTAKHSARLGAYLAAGLGASTIASSTVDAAIVLIDIGPSGFNIGGINADVNFGSARLVSNFPFAGQGYLALLNGPISPESPTAYGLYAAGGLSFAINGGIASPRNFSLNEAIGSAASFGTFGTTVFKYEESSSPDFSAGSFMGFKTGSGNFGWLEVTWTAKTSQYQILSGAYEDVAGVTILAGDTGTAAVPEPSTWAMSALLAGGVAFTVWRKRRAAAQAKAQAA